MFDSLTFFEKQEDNGSFPSNSVQKFMSATLTRPKLLDISFNALTPQGIPGNDSTEPHSSLPYTTTCNITQDTNYLGNFEKHDGTHVIVGSHEQRQFKSEEQNLCHCEFTESNTEMQNLHDTMIDEIVELEKWLKLNGNKTIPTFPTNEALHMYNYTSDSDDLTTDGIFDGDSVAGSSASSVISENSTDNNISFSSVWSWTDIDSNLNTMMTDPALLSNNEGMTDTGFHIFKSPDFVNDKSDGKNNLSHRPSNNVDENNNEETGDDYISLQSTGTQTDSWMRSNNYYILKDLSSNKTGDHKNISELPIAKASTYQPPHQPAYEPTQLRKVLFIGRGTGTTGIVYPLRTASGKFITKQKSCCISSGSHPSSLNQWR